MSFAPVHAQGGEFEEARALVVAQKWNEALPILKKLHEEEPDSATIGQELAQVLLRLNRREEALELLRQHRLTKAAEIAAKTFLSKESFRFYQQGLDWLTKRAYAQACDRFERALEKDQGHFEILLRLAQCEALDGNADLALKLFDQIERVHGKTPETQLWRARMLAQRNRAEEALPLFATLAAAARPPEPNAEWIVLWWSEALLGLGKKSDAAAILEEDVRKYPAHLQTGLAWLRLRFSQAESPNQFLALEKELREWSARLTERSATKKKREPEFVLDPFDGESLQRSATELRVQILAQIPSPTPAPSSDPSAKPSSSH